MFTGIIQTMGRVLEVMPQGVDRRFVIAPEGWAPDALASGDSVSVQGVCLTAFDIDSQGFAVDASAETLAASTLGELAAGDWVNLEPALTLNTRLGGHLVSGHVDGVGEVTERYPEGRAVRLWIAAPAELGRYIAARGSITVDGVSLTVNAVAGNRLQLNIVPYTLEQTTLGALKPGSRVNLEVDLIARYLERLLGGDEKPGLTAAQLRAAGFTADEHGG